MSAFIIKNVNDQVAMLNMVKQIETNKTSLLTIQQQVDQIEKNRNAIRVHEKGNFFWTQILRIQALRSEANFDKFEDLVKEVPTINQLSKELTSLGLIKNSAN